MQKRHEVIEKLLALTFSDSFFIKPDLQLVYTVNINSVLRPLTMQLKLRSVLTTALLAILTTALHGK